MFRDDQTSLPIDRQPVGADMTAGRPRLGAGVSRGRDEHAGLPAGDQLHDGVGGDVAEQQRPVASPDRPFDEPESAGHLLDHRGLGNDRVECRIELDDTGGPLWCRSLGKQTGESSGHDKQR